MTDLTPLTRHPVAHFVMDHPGTALGVLSATAVILRTLAVARYQPEVALAILNGGGLSGLVLGSAIVTLPLAAPIAWVYLGLVGSEARTGGSPQVAGLDEVRLAVGFVALLITPLILLVVVAIAEAYLWLRRPLAAKLSPPYERLRRTFKWRWLTKFGPQPARRSPQQLAVGTVVATSLVVAFVTSDPWLPPEIVKTGGTPYVAYVLGTSDRWVTILDDNPRIVDVVESRDFDYRFPCLRSRFGLLETIPGLLQGQEMEDFLDCNDLPES